MVNIWSLTPLLSEREPKSALISYQSRWSSISEIQIKQERRLRQFAVYLLYVSVSQCFWSCVTEAKPVEAMNSLFSRVYPYRFSLSIYRCKSSLWVVLLTVTEQRRYEARRLFKWSFLSMYCLSLQNSADMKQEGCSSDRPLSMNHAELFLDLYFLSSFFFQLM